MIGKTLGHYKVGEQLGRGGMGEVYLADDLNLNRKVALKFLPDAFAGDPERMARFEREAKLLASLNHPNIAAIHGLEEAEGKRFLVLELVEGETLAQRLSKGPLPVEEALEVSLPASDPVQVFKFGGKVFGLDDWSPDGQYLLYHDTNQPELWALPLAGDRKPMLVTRSLAGFADQGQFSPDGRWIAYNTNESDRHEVKVVPFPPNGEKWQISTSGGVQPTWRGDGKELFFLAPDATLMAADVRPGCAKTTSAF